MANGTTNDQNLPQKAIEANCEVLTLVEWLRNQSVNKKNERYAQALRQIRAHVVRNNTYICQAWFPKDHLGDLDSPPDAA